MPSIECQPGLPVPAAERSFRAKLEVWGLCHSQCPFICTGMKLVPEVGLDLEARPGRSAVDHKRVQMHVPSLSLLRSSPHSSLRKLSSWRFQTPKPASDSLLPTKKGQVLHYGSQALYTIFMLFSHLGFKLKRERSEHKHIGSH